MSQVRLNLPRRKVGTGTLPTEPGITIPWKYWPAHRAPTDRALWLVVLGENESLDSKPEWLAALDGGAATLLIAPRGSGSFPVPDPPPFYVKRSLALLGRTLDDCRLADIVAAVAQVLSDKAGGGLKVKIAGRGTSGILAAYVALLEPRLSEVVVVDPPASHRDGPTFLNILRVVDVPAALGLLAPRPLTLCTARNDAFDPTAALYRVANGTLNLRPLP